MAGLGQFMVRLMAAMIAAASSSSAVPTELILISGAKESDIARADQLSKYLTVGLLFSAGNRATN
jgi:hypothetical protein